MSNMHELRTPVSKRLVGAAGVLAALVMLGVSGTLNFRYGYTLGATNIEGIGIGLAAVSADVFMALALFFCIGAWKKREWTKAIAAFVLWVSMTAICTWSAVSQMSFNRLEASGEREVAVIGFDDLRKELADARAALGFIPQHRPEAVVKAELDGLKTKPIWTQTGECAEEINGRTAREFCQNFQRLKSELGSALEAAKVRSKIESLVAKSERTTEAKGAKVVTEVDAGAKAWSTITGLSVKTTQVVGAFLFAYMLLSGTGIGLWVSLGTLREANEMARALQRPPTIDITPLPPPLPPVAAVADPAAAKLPPPAAATKRVEVVTAAKAARRPEPSSEARDMLTMIKFPLAPIRNKQLRTKDPREHVGWRFLAWMAAYGLQGSYPHEKIDSLYFEFAQADHREPWGSRIVKAELESLRFVTKSTPEGKVHWNITPPSIAKLVEIMEKTPKQNPVINPTPKTDDTDVADGNVVPLGRRPA